MQGANTIRGKGVKISKTLQMQMIINPLMEQFGDVLRYYQSWHLGRNIVAKGAVRGVALGASVALLGRLGKREHTIIKPWWILGGSIVLLGKIVKQDSNIDKLMWLAGGGIAALSIGSAALKAISLPGSKVEHQDGEHLIKSFSKDVQFLSARFLDGMVRQETKSLAGGFLAYLLPETYEASVPFNRAQWAIFFKAMLVADGISVDLLDHFWSKTDKPRTLLNNNEVSQIIHCHQLSGKQDYRINWLRAHFVGARLTLSLVYSGPQLGLPPRPQMNLLYQNLGAQFALPPRPQVHLSFHSEELVQKPPYILADAQTWPEVPHFTIDEHAGEFGIPEIGHNFEMFKFPHVNIDKTPLDFSEPSDSLFEKEAITPQFSIFNSNELSVEPREPNSNAGGGAILFANHLSFNDNFSENSSNLVSNQISNNNSNNDHRLQPEGSLVGMMFEIATYRFGTDRWNYWKSFLEECIEDQNSGDDWWSALLRTPMSGGDTLLHCISRNFERRPVDNSSKVRVEEVPSPDDPYEQSLLALIGWLQEQVHRRSKKSENEPKNRRSGILFGAFLSQNDKGDTPMHLVQAEKLAECYRELLTACGESFSVFSLFHKVNEQRLVFMQSMSQKAALKFFDVEIMDRLYSELLNSIKDGGRPVLNTAKDETIWHCMAQMPSLFDQELGRCAKRQDLGLLMYYLNDVDLNGDNCLHIFARGGNGAVLSSIKALPPETQDVLIKMCYQLNNDLKTPFLIRSECGSSGARPMPIDGDSKMLPVLAADSTSGKNWPEEQEEEIGESTLFLFRKRVESGGGLPFVCEIYGRLYRKTDPDLILEYFLHGMQDLMLLSQQEGDIGGIVAQLSAFLVKEDGRPIVNENGDTWLHCLMKNDRIDDKTRIAVCYLLKRYAEQNNFFACALTFNHGGELANGLSAKMFPKGEDMVTQGDNSQAVQSREQKLATNEKRVVIYNSQARTAITQLVCQHAKGKIMDERGMFLAALRRATPDEMSYIAGSLWDNGYQDEVMQVWLKGQIGSSVQLLNGRAYAYASKAKKQSPFWSTFFGSLTTSWRNMEGFIGQLVFGELPQSAKIAFIKSVFASAYGAQYLPQFFIEAFKCLETLGDSPDKSSELLAILCDVASMVSDSANFIRWFVRLSNDKPSSKELLGKVLAVKKDIKGHAELINGFMQCILAGISRTYFINQESQDRQEYATWCEQVLSEWAKLGTCNLKPSIFKALIENAGDIKNVGINVISFLFSNGNIEYKFALDFIRSLLERSDVAGELASGKYAKLCGLIANIQNKQDARTIDIMVSFAIAFCARQGRGSLFFDKSKCPAVSSVYQDLFCTKWIERQEDWFSNLDSCNSSMFLDGFRIICDHRDFGYTMPSSKTNLKSLQCYFQSIDSNPLFVLLRIFDAEDDVRKKIDLLNMIKSLIELDNGRLLLESSACSEAKGRGYELFDQLIKPGKMWGYSWQDNWSKNIDNKVRELEPLVRENSRSNNEQNVNEIDGHDGNFDTNEIIDDSASNAFRV